MTTNFLVFLLWEMWISIPCVFSCGINRKPTKWTNGAQYVLLFRKWCVVRLSLSKYAKTINCYHLKNKNKYDMWLTLISKFKNEKKPFIHFSWTYRYNGIWSKHTGCRKQISIYHLPKNYFLYSLPFFIKLSIRFKIVF